MYTDVSLKISPKLYYNIQITFQTNVGKVRGQVDLSSITAVEELELDALGKSNAFQVSSKVFKIPNWFEALYSLLYMFFLMRSFWGNFSDKSSEPLPPGRLLENTASEFEEDMYNGNEEALDRGGKLLFGLHDKCEWWCRLLSKECLEKVESVAYSDAEWIITKRIGLWEMCQLPYDIRQWNAADEGETCSKSWGNTDENDKIDGKDTFIDLMHMLSPPTVLYSKRK